MKTKLLIIPALLCGINIYAQRNVPSYVDTTDLRGWYAFSNNADDSSGLGNHGMTYNIQARGDRFNNADRAYHFIGAPHPYSHQQPKSYVRMNNIVNGLNFSVSVWAKMDVPVKNSYIISAWSGGNEITGIGFDDSLTYFDATGITSFARITCDPIKDNNWHHFVGIVTADSMLLYIDDTLKAVKQVTNYASYTSEIFNAGWPGAPSVSTGTDRGFRGAIDDIGLWNKALTRQQVTDLYKAIHVPVSVNNTSKANDIKIYPNPVKDIVTINSNKIIKKVEILNLLGQVVYTGDYNSGRVDVDLRNINIGQYIIRVNDSVHKNIMIRF